MTIPIVHGSSCCTWQFLQYMAVLVVHGSSDSICQFLLYMTVFTVHGSSYRICQFLQYMAVFTVHGSSCSTWKFLQYIAVLQYMGVLTVHCSYYSTWQFLQYTAIVRVQSSSHSIVQFLKYMTACSPKQRFAVVLWSMLLKGWCPWHKTWLQMMMLGPLSKVMMVRQPFCTKNMQNSHFCVQHLVPPARFYICNWTERYCDPTELHKYSTPPQVFRNYGTARFCKTSVQCHSFWKHAVL